MKLFYVVSVLLTAAAPAFAGVTVTSPANGVTVNSPVQYVATATTTTCATGVASMGIYVNNKLTYVVNGASLNTALSLNPGPYNTVVEEWDKCGGASYTPVAITVAHRVTQGLPLSGNYSPPRRLSGHWPASTLPPPSGTRERCP